MALNEASVAHSCCVADLTITLHVAWFDDCSRFIFLPLTSEFWGNFVQSVHALFHSDVSRYHF